MVERSGRFIEEIGSGSCVPGRVVHTIGISHQFMNTRRRDRPAAHRDAISSQRVLHCVGDRGWRANRTAFAQALYPQRIARRRAFGVFEFYGRQIVRPRQRIIHKAAAQWLAHRIIDEALAERAANTLRDAADYLAVGKHRVDHAAAVVHDEVALKRNPPSLSINGDDRTMRRAGIGGLRNEICRLCRLR